MAGSFPDDPTDADTALTMADWSNFKKHQAMKDELVEALKIDAEKKAAREAAGLIEEMTENAVEKLEPELQAWMRTILNVETETLYFRNVSDRVMHTWGVHFDDHVVLWSAIEAKRFHCSGKGIYALESTIGGNAKAVTVKGVPLINGERRMEGEVTVGKLYRLGELIEPLPPYIDAKLIQLGQRAVVLDGEAMGAVGPVTDSAHSFATVCGVSHKLQHLGLVVPDGDWSRVEELLPAEAIWPKGTRVVVMPNLQPGRNDIRTPRQVRIIGWNAIGQGRGLDNDDNVIDFNRSHITR